MTDEKSKSGDDGGKLLYCSFCGKSQHEVRKLIAGPSVFICDECVDRWNDIQSLIHYLLEVASRLIDEVIASREATSSK